MSECSVDSVVDGQEFAGINFTRDFLKLLVITGKYWRLLEITGNLLESTRISCQLTDCDDTKAMPYTSSITPKS